MNCVANEPCYKGTILWSFSYNPFENSRLKKLEIATWLSYIQIIFVNSFIKLHGKKIGNHNMTVLYPKPCYNKVCYKGSALY